ncbi:hypothetical protein GIY23_17400 [Allosaccharopolyspora coralli]|uniref:Uncharacterized protein n=1 Tax=Allosaccharopolyspora coralli TaxID=2665642 RepID=A0A5Q3QB35_9PSEU|nr:DUF5825 family protein [Allosaccharopolyspora coralli]QGK71060.1 hypothetical protein GIY23_17400 [Allosaccharopolyspora coralli]
MTSKSTMPPECSRTGEVRLTSTPANPVPTARSLCAAGTTRVTLVEPVAIAADGDDLRRLDLVRELTAWAVECDWTLRVNDQRVDELPDWRAFAHLYPPRWVDGDCADRVDLAEWCNRWYPGRCLMRHGPGLVEVRDRRRDVLDRYVVDDAAYVEALRELGAGRPPASVAPWVAESLQEAGLLVALGERLWWAPVRVRRWPVPAMVV